MRHRICFTLFCLSLSLSIFQDEGDGNSFEDDDDDDDEGYEPWALAAHHASMPAASMAAKYALLGRKQGEDDLGEGRAGVVRKCLEVGQQGQEPSEGQQAADGQQLVVRACKCISKRQQSEEETDRELAILRKLRGNKKRAVPTSRGHIRTC